MLDKLLKYKIENGQNLNFDLIFRFNQLLFQDQFNLLFSILVIFSFYVRFPN